MISNEHDSIIAILRAASLILLVVAFQVAAARSVYLSSREAKRRWQHALTGHALVQISYYMPVSMCVFALFAAALGLWSLPKNDARRVPAKIWAAATTARIGTTTLARRFLFLLGAALTAAFFPIHTARYAVECLALADPIAAWAGQSIRSPHVMSPSATVAGCAACFVASWVIGYVMLQQDNGDSNVTPWLPVTVGAIACCMAEALPVGSDNLTIPIATAFSVELARWSQSRA